jgi:hypothetical protein
MDTLQFMGWEAAQGWIVVIGVCVESQILGTRFFIIFFFELQYSLIRVEIVLRK